MIKVIEKAARVLAVIGVAEGIGAAELSRQLGINKATLSHLLATLVEVGYVRRGADGSYGLGPALLDLARPEVRRETLAGPAEVAARRLVAELGEMVSIATLHRGERYVLAKVTPDQSVAVDPRIEDRRSPFGTATGRVLLAWAPAAELELALVGQAFPLRRWPAVTSPAELDQALGAIRAAGLDDDVTPDGEAAQVAVPVLDRRGRVVLAIGTSVPCYRFPEPRRQEVIAALQAVAVRLSETLAWYWDEEGGR